MKWKPLRYILLSVVVAGIFAVTLPRKWKLPKAGEVYAVHFFDAAAQFDLPPDLLPRVAQQESSFRPEVISGEVTSPAGAVGLMQIVPRWHPDVDPTDPVASISYAAQWLRKLFDRFGSWELALAAYNWGPGNLNRYIGQGKWADFGIDEMPEETRNYITQIRGDVGYQWEQAA